MVFSVRVKQLVAGDRLSWSHFVVWLVMLLPLSLGAQHHHAFYRMLAVPQSTILNPAFERRPDIYIGMPLLSSLYVNYVHTGFAWEDFLRKDQQGAFYYDENHMLAQLGKKNLFSLNLSQEWLAGGFRRNDTDYSFSVSEKGYFTTNYNHDLLALLIKGNDYFVQEGRRGDLSGLYMDLVHYREFALGLSRRQTDKTRLGLRIKALFGQSTVWFDKSEMQFHTDPDTYAWLIDADIRLHTSGPVSFSRGEGLAFSTQVNASPAEYMFHFRNPGLGIDLGVEYELYPSVYISASMMDIGLIYWRDNLQSRTLQGQFDYRGLDFRDMADQISVYGFESVIDSLLGIFEVGETRRAFLMPLNPVAFVSLYVVPDQRHTFGLMGRGILFRKKFHPSLALQYQFEPTDGMGLSFSYAVMPGSFNNLGAGAYIELGAVQLYLVFDNIIAFMRPHTAQLANFHLGINWVFTREQKSELPWHCW
jgi:hypothetical protein